jgi:Oxidoreductase-like protein, N-terminal
MSLQKLSAMPVSDASNARAMFALAHALAASQGVMLRSTPPEPTTCCGRGCNGCVWEGFLAAANYWREDALASLGSQL